MDFQTGWIIFNKRYLFTKYENNRNSNKDKHIRIIILIAIAKILNINKI